MSELIYFENSTYTNQLPNYPLECFHSINPIQDSKSLLHWHFYCEMMFVYKGKEQVNIGGKNLTINSGDIIYIHPHLVHEIINVAELSEITILKFDTSLLFSQSQYEVEKQYWMPFLPESGFQCLTFENMVDEVKPLLDKLIEEEQSRFVGYEIRMRNLVCNILTILNDSLTRFGSQNSNNIISEKEQKQFNQMLQYIATHFYEEDLIQTALKICNLSYSNFAVKFKKMYGKTFSEHINSVRVYYAQQMLSGTDNSMSSISEACGYHDPCYFSRIFRKLTGITPLTYRQMYSNK